MYFTVNLKPSAILLIIFIQCASGQLLNNCSDIDVQMYDFLNANRTSIPPKLSELNTAKVTVCEHSKTVFYVAPLAIWNFGSIRDEVYDGFTKKYNFWFRMQITSKDILNKISRLKQFKGAAVKFMNVKMVKFVTRSDDYHKLGKTVFLNEDWLTPVINTTTNEAFVRLEMGADLKDTRTHILSTVIQTVSKWQTKSLAKSIGVEFKVEDTRGGIQTRAKNLDVQFARRQLDILENLIDTQNISAFTVLNIFSLSNHTLLTAPCVVENEWILMQTRETPGFDFNRKWDDFKRGFGNWKSDFWLGMEKIYEITRNGGRGLRLEFETHEGIERSAEWREFKIGTEGEKYKLYVSGFNTESSVGNHDRLNWSNGSDFATVDRDNAYFCAKTLGGGWWMRPQANKDCVDVHFNNDLRSTNGSSETCVHYLSFEGKLELNECLKRTRMFIIKST